MWSSWNQALQAGCLVSAWAVALMMMSLKETLPAWSPNWLFRASRASLARSMSTSVVRKKWGMGPSDVASRLAMVLRIWVNGTSWYAAPVRSGGGTRETGNGAATVAAGAAGVPGLGARSRSFLTTRPPGPDPVTSFRSTPASFAIRRASGEAFTRVASAGATDGNGATAAGAAAAAVATFPPSRFPLADEVAGGAAAAVAPTFSPDATMTATTLPTATVWPSAAATWRSTPSARATRSITALSVSTSASVSPVFTGSPSRLCHFTTRPSSIVGESASIYTLVAMGGGRQSR